MNALRRLVAGRDPRHLGVALVSLLLAGGVLLSTGPATADPLVGSSTGRAQPAYSETRTIQRTFVNADGTTYSFPARTMTVTADQTSDLRGRQRILIQWSGAQPSGGRGVNPFGENGLNQEYPVVVLQCRGVDDPAAPERKRVRPETCWTTSVAQRSQVARSEGDALWTVDAAADEADRQRLSGLDPFPTERCPAADVAGYYSHLTPFVAADGTVYPACSADTMPPEAAVGAAFPPAELAAFTGQDGTGEVQFEVRSDVENESLGCNNDTACTIVVVPIVGLSCTAPADPAAVVDNACRKGGRFLPGSSNFAGEGVDAAVGPALWWSESNWANRFSIPISFGLPPDACDILDTRPPTGFYGTELLAQAALQWSPAYCLREDRFKFQHNQMSDEAGFNLMESGEAAAAEVSSEREQRGSDPVAYAPTAITGFGIGYVADKPDNAGEVTDLRLNARLVAKLLTQSYLGSDLGRGHPGMGDNPLSLLVDPEFIELNPGLSRTSQEAAATLLSLSNSSDVIEQLTDWIAHDKAAVAFVDGKADEWGMVVNPAYEGLDLPRSDIPLLDEYVPETESTCRQENPGVYFNQLAAPVTTMRKIAEAVLDGWPNVQTRCDFDTATGLFKLGRMDRQNVGSRFMLGLVSLGDAERYGLRLASLEASPGDFVAPTTPGLAAAVALMEQDQPRWPFVLDQAQVRRSAKAYPGTMVVYTAARTGNLDQDSADKVAQFIRISTTEGQRPGSGNGMLPEGFLPLTRTGVTAPLFVSAQQVAAAVQAQADTGKASPGPSDGGGPAGGGGVSTGGAVPGAPVDAAASEPAVPGASPSAVVEAVDMPPTQAISSRAARGLLPSLLLVGLLGLAIASLLRFFGTPPAPPRSAA